jgi:hypothetical protein
LLYLRQHTLIIMSDSAETRILTKIKRGSKGSIYFTDSFLKIGSAKTVSKALERLVQKGEILRIATGIYVRPKIDPVIGAVTPALEEVVAAIAKRDHARIVPTGAYALNKLGLSTQVPTNVVYLTDGAARKVRIGRRNITFKRTTPKNLSAKGEITGLVIQALKSIGKDKLTSEELSKIAQVLRRENPVNIKRDMALAPVWMRSILALGLRKEKSHE